MENKQTALNWILDKLAPYIYYPYAHSSGYDVEELIEQAKAMEKEQIKNAYLEASKQTCWSYGEDPPSDDNIYAEDYYNKTYANDTTTGLPTEDSKRRGWHY